MAAPYLRSGSHPSSHAHSMHSRSSSSSGFPRNRVDETNLTLMELENNQRWEELGEQVDLLKNLTKDIHAEVNSQNKLLDSMGLSFNSAGELFSSTTAKLSNMLNTSSGKHMYYLAGFVVFVFLVIYYMMGRK